LRQAVIERLYCHASIDKRQIAARFGLDFDAHFADELHRLKACSLGVIGRGVDRLSVGFGMIPRGEVGLIFAVIGRGLMEQGKPVIESPVLRGDCRHGHGHHARDSAATELVPAATTAFIPAMRCGVSGAGCYRTTVMHLANE
jgi:hypothetical protein